MNDKTVIVNDVNFADEVLKYNGLVVVDFWAEWCGPCRMLGPVIDAVAVESSAKVCKLNVDDAPDTAKKFGVMMIPTVLFFKNGEVVDKSVGAVPKSKIAELISKNI